MEMLKPGNIGKDIQDGVWVYLGKYRDARKEQVGTERHVYIYCGSIRYGMSVRLETEQDFAALNTQILHGIYNVVEIKAPEFPMELKKIGADHDTVIEYPPYSRRIEEAVERYGRKVFIPTHLDGLVRI